MRKPKEKEPAYERKLVPDGFMLSGTYPYRGVVASCHRCHGAVRQGPYFYRRMKRHATLHAEGRPVPMPKPPSWACPRFDDHWAWWECPACMEGIAREERKDGWIRRGNPPIVLI
jgi:hypothetical protein